MSGGKILVTFADLTHTGQVVAANTFPYGISRIASAARAAVGETIEAEIFKYPTDFSRFLAERLPAIACFSNYLWNVELAHAYATAIKRARPQTVVVFGGPNYPMEEEEQRRFLAAHPAIDFYVVKEGEMAFAGLVKALLETGLDLAALTEGDRTFPGVHYLRQEQLIKGDPLARLNSLDDVPSPYLTGLLDKFFDGVLTPMIETNRGCPFGCTFCIEGNPYFNKVQRSSLARIRQDLAYIAQRNNPPDLLVTDSNFGMYKEDLDTCDAIAEMQKAYGWPKYVSNSSGKNQKQRIIEAARRLDGALILTMSVQSLDARVLEAANRRNISIEHIIEAGRMAETLGANSYCEIVLGLPGDSRQAHFDSVTGMIDAGINTLLTYQMMLLPGTEAGSAESRQRYGSVGRYRVLPRCYGVYDILGKSIPVAEVEEICVEGNRLSFDDYLDCRGLSLSVELFYNGGLFRDVIELLARFDIKPSRFLLHVHAQASAPASALKDIYEAYLKENVDKLFSSLSEIKAYLETPGIVERFVSGELGGSELYRAKVKAIFERQGPLHELVYDAAFFLLKDRAVPGSALDGYLRQLKAVSLARKDRLLDVGEERVLLLDYDFSALAAGFFKADPNTHRLPEPRTFAFAHGQEQKELIALYVRQYGTSIEGLGRILLRSHYSKFFRTISPVGPKREVSFARQ